MLRNISILIFTVFLTAGCSFLDSKNMVMEEEFPLEEEEVLAVYMSPISSDKIFITNHGYVEIIYVPGGISIYHRLHRGHNPNRSGVDVEFFPSKLGIYNEDEEGYIFLESNYEGFLMISVEGEISYPIGYQSIDNRIVITYLGVPILSSNEWAIWAKKALLKGLLHF